MGRKSGITRSNPLPCVPPGQKVYIAGSNVDGPNEPGWVKNMEAHLEVTVRRNGATRAREARVLDGDERAAAWSHMLKTWPNFARYEERIERVIKVFELTATAT